MKEFKNKESEEYRYYRNEFRDNYTFIEDFASNKFNSGNYLDRLSESTNATTECKEEIIKLIKQDYIRSNNYGFEVRPDIKNATDLLRNEFLGEKNEHQYKKSLERALYELLQAIRDNITHSGKFEHDDEQYERNFKLVKYAYLISSSIVGELEKK